MLFLRDKVFPQGTCVVVLISLSCCLQHLPLRAAESGAAHNVGDLPLVIPHPQVIEKLGDRRIVLAEHGSVVSRTIAAERSEFFDEAANLVRAALEKRRLTMGSRPPRTTIVLATKAAQRTAPKGYPASPVRDVPALTPAESAVLARSDQAYVIRMKPGPDARIWITGATPLGTYYGATTLVQLATAVEPKTVAVPHVEVRDYPDTPGRMAADWVLQWDWEVNGYDWGDGLEAFLARCKRKIDLCSRYKVNRVRFLGGRISPGPSYMAERYKKIKRFALELNRYARRKGVVLQWSSSSWGVDYYSWGLPYPEPWVLNRERYPDGPVYACVGGTVGGCLSNDALTGLIAARQKRLVEDTEPGSIYLHRIDVATYADLARVWKTRCPRCRRRFPDDEPCSPKGYAAAVARLYNRIVAELKSVKNPQSGYDASRDLEIVFASPGYSYSTESDADWDSDLKYFREIGRQLKDRRNVAITFREQYKRLDNRGLRIEEMARALQQVGWPNAPFVFAAQGGGFLENCAMFVSSPVLTEINRGAGTLYNVNGHVHSEVQVLANVNYAWNHHAPGWVDPMPFAGRALQEEAVRYAWGTRHSDYLYGRFLETACAALYGEQAAPAMVALFRFERDKGPILAVPAWIDLQWKNAGYDWRAQAERNLAAKPLAEQAAAKCDTEAKEDLVWLSKCLEVGARLCRLCDAVYRQKRPRAEIDACAAELLAWLHANFQFHPTDPDGGDPGLWRNLIGRLREVAGPKAR